MAQGAPADLVIPIPSSINQQSLQQSLQFQNSTLAIFGVASGATINGFGGGNFGFGGGGFGAGGFHHTEASMRLVEG